MNSMKKYIALVIAMIVPFALVANANAASETVTATTTLAPQGGGNYFKEVVLVRFERHFF